MMSSSMLIKPQKSTMKAVFQVVLPSLFILSLLNIISSIELLAYINRFVDRKAIFLFFNALLLLIIARDSGLLATNSCVELCDKGRDVRAHTDEVKAGIVVTEEKVVVEHIDTPLEDVVLEEKVVVEHIDTPLEQDVVLEEKGHEVGSVEGWELVVVEEEEQEQETEQDLEMDEFKRRCDEFIEKFYRSGGKMEN